MKIELDGFINYFYVRDKGKEYTVMMMGDNNSKSFGWEIYCINESRDVNEELKNKIIEAVIKKEGDKIWQRI